MTRVIVAAGIDNELKSRDISSVKRLVQAGYDIEFYYYLPKVPAEYTMLPSVNVMLLDWKKHAAKILQELGAKLSIGTTHRHFVDEVLGPDRLFDEVRALHADIILTNDHNQLKQSLLARWYIQIAAFFKGSQVLEIPIENPTVYTEDKLGKVKVSSFTSDKRSAVNDPSVWPESEKKHFKNGRK